MKNILLILSIAICGTAIAQNTCTPLITNGLVAYYPFCGNANDVSGNGNDGTVNGASLTTDRFGNANSAYSFDGITSYINIGHNAILRRGNTDFSISAWVYLNSNNVSYSSAILTNRSGSPTTNVGTMFCIEGNLSSPGKVKIITADPNWVHSNSAISNGQWYHVAVTYNRSTLVTSCYINGTLINTGTLQNFSESTTFDNTIGREPLSSPLGGGNAYALNGKIDDIYLYNRVLSNTEIQELYNNNTNLNCIVAYYPFTGNANDASGNGNDGIVNGATLTTDRFGNPNSAYSFDGVTSYINIGHNAILRRGNTDFSISAWVYLNSNNVSYSSAILTNRSGSPTTNVGTMFCIEGNLSSPGKVKIITADPNWVHSNTAISNGQWYHVAVTYNRSTLVTSCYINGTLINTGTLQNFSESTTFDNTIGREPLSSPLGGGNAYALNGKLDEIYIFNCAISASDVMALYNGTTGTKELSNNSDFTFYPNPTDGIVFISGIKNESVVVYNALGATVKETKAQNKIDLSLMSDGLYFIQVIDENGKIMRSEKIIKK